MSGLCLAAGTLSAVIHAQSFTLAWMHSIEKIRWEEDWEIRSGALHLIAARIRGTGAGMEPPEGAKLIDGVWHYQPETPALKSLDLAHSPYTRGYELCLAGQCGALAAELPGIPETTVITLSVCP